jgi:hypothetical protein
MSKSSPSSDEIKKEKERIAREHFKARMNLPIGTSPYGFLLTNEMKENARRFNEAFENRKEKEREQKEKERIAREHFKARMNLPIGTSPYGFSLSDKIITDNKRIEENFFPCNRNT